MVNKEKELALSIEELDNKMEIFAALYESIEMDYRKIRRGNNGKPLSRVRGNMTRISKLMKLLRRDFRVYDALAEEIRADFKEKGEVKRTLINKPK